jgi:hypothetical protein
MVRGYRLPHAFTFRAPGTLGVFAGSLLRNDRSNQLPGSPHENLTCALIPCIRRGPDKSCNKTGVSSEPRGSPGTRGDPTGEPPLKFRASLMCAPDARVERPVSFNALQWRSKTSVTTNRSATAVNAAISVVVRSLRGLESLVAPVATVGSFSMTCLTAATLLIDPPANDPIPLAGQGLPANSRSSLLAEAAFATRSQRASPRLS